MMPFIKKIWLFLTSESTTDEVQQLQQKKKQLEEQLLALDTIEKELLEAKKVAEEPLKTLNDAE